MSSNETKAYYDRYWKDGVDDWTPRQATISPLERALVERYVDREAKVLDFGCGDGSRMADVIRPGGGSYVGLDVSEEAVSLCRARGLDARLCEPGTPLPFDGESFNAVISFEVLEHLFRPDVSVGEIRRVLAPGGVFLGSVPNVAFIGNRVLFALGFFNAGGSPATSLRRPWEDPHIRFFTQQTLRALLRATGFGEVRVQGGPFSLLHLPVLYRAGGGPARLLELVSKPFGPLGTLMPSVFSHRLYFVARKTNPGP